MIIWRSPRDSSPEPARRLYVRTLFVRWPWIISWGSILRLGKGLEQAGGRTRHAILEDMVESIFGAVYLDGGLEAVTPIIEKWVLSRLRMGEDLRDDKTKRRSWCRPGQVAPSSIAWRKKAVRRIVAPFE